MNWGKYFIVLVGLSVVLTFFLFKRQIRQGKPGCGIVIFIFLPIMLASFIWVCTLLLLLYLNGGV